MAEASLPRWLIALLEERDRALEDWTKKLVETLRTSGGDIVTLATEAVDSGLQDHLDALDPHSQYTLDTDLATTLTGYVTTGALTTALADYILKTLADTKGDLLVAGADNSWSKLPVGADGDVLVADSAELLGVKWDAAGGGGAGDNDTDPNNMGSINHGSNASEPRITWAGPILWIGSVQPSNAAVGDVWAETP